MENYFSINLKKLAQQQTQKSIALKTGVSQSSITNYINNTSEPSLNFLMQLKEHYGINIDDFLLKNLTFNNSSLLNTYNERFIGNYIIYYYDTSAYKGNSNVYTKNALNYGLVSICYDSSATDSNKLAAYGQFLLNRKTAEETLNTLNALSDKNAVKSYYNNLEDHYCGEINIQNNHLFISLANNNKQDACFMILNNPPSGKSYIGGIATVNSISRGREHMPCIQYSIISKYVLNITDGEVYNLLTLDTPEINIDLNIEQLIKLFKSLYINSNESNIMLNDYQKKRILEESVKDTLHELLETNVFKYAKISDMEDDKYYRIIKEQMLNA